VFLPSNLSVVFSFGSGEKGQLGNGRTGEHITTGNKSAFDVEPQPSKYSCSCTFLVCLYLLFEVLVKGLEDKKIVQIACGPQHSIALDSTGLAISALRGQRLTIL